MKKYIFQIVAAAALALAGWSCETDYYNEHYLDGYDPGDGVTDVQQITYELTDADYSSIASNSTNKALAEAAGQSDVLAAVGTNKYFTAEEDALTYIKAFVSDKYTSYLSNGSGVSVIYRLAEELSEELAAKNKPKSYTLTTDDYKKAWGDEEKFIDALTPSTIGKLASVISNADVEADEYMVVTYKYQDNEPSFGGEDSVEPEPFQYSDVIKTITTTTDGTETVTINGYVTGVHNNGFIVSDLGGSILVYGSTTKPKLGDNVTVTGPVNYYSYSLQIQKKEDVEVSVTINTDSDLYLYSETPTVHLDESNIDSYTEAFATADNNLPRFGSITGKLVKSGNYYNIICGEAKVQGSVASPTSDITDQLKDGETITVNGYLLAATSSAKYMSILVTSVGEQKIAYKPVPMPYGDGSEKYLLVAEKEGTNYAFTAISGKTYGYPDGSEVTVTNNTIAADVADNLVLTFAAADNNAYTLQDNEKQYYYLTTYNSFNVGADLGTTGYTYTITPNEDGTVTILNDNGMWIQYGQGSYTTWGAYNSQRGSNPVLYRLVSVPTNDTNATVFAARRAAAAPNAETRYGFFKYNGSSFTNANIAIVQPSDYTEMGQSYGNFTDPDQDIYLPKFLNKNFPYAMADDVKEVLYRCYKNSATNWAVDEYTNDGTTWVKNGHIANGNAPYKKTADGWLFDPSLTIILNPDKSELSVKYYQACVDWVIANKDQAYTWDDRNSRPVTNAEYYSGCAANYTNLNWRLNTLPWYYWSPAGDDVSAYEDWQSETPAVAKACYEAFYTECEKRFGEVMSAALGVLHSDQKMISGVDIIYTVQMMVYTQHIGSSTGRVTHAFEFKLVADGTFEYVGMYPLEEKFDLYYELQ